MVTAATVLRQARRQAGMSQRTAALAAGVRQPLFSRIESGRSQPSLATLDRLVRACGYALLVSLEPLPDPHDVSLLESTLSLTPEQRVDRLVELHRVAGELQAAVLAAEPDVR